MSRGATRVLSEFVCEARLERLPSDLVQIAKLRLIDSIGAMIVGARRPWSQAVSRYSTAMEQGCGPATVIGSSTRCSPAMAALANGNMGHADEIDDAHDEALSHLGVVVVPAALAVAEEQGASGSDLLCALVVGYELAARAGVAVGATRHMLRGFYPTGTGCVFGAAAAAAKLLQLDAGTLAYAFGIAGSFASGIVEYAQSGGTVKWLHAGRAAEGGVTAAYLARNGLTGPPTVLEGRFGFCNVFSDRPETDRLLAKLGKDFAIRVITVKPYACCSDIHPVIDALLEIKSSHGVRLEDIQQVLVEGPRKLIELNLLDGTQSIFAAKYSVPLTAGLVFRRDIRDPAIYDETLLDDEELGAFQKNVKMTIAQDLDDLYPKVIAARVTVTVRNGEQWSAESLGALGSVHNPLTEEQILEKFRINVASTHLRAYVDQILDCIGTIERAPTARGLTSLLAREA